MEDYPEIKMCGADMPILTTSPASETPETNRVMELAEALKPGTVVVRVAHARSLERRLREAEGQLSDARADVIRLHKDKMDLLDEKLAAERGKGLVWCEAHGPYKGQECPHCFPAAEEKK